MFSDLTANLPKDPVESITEQDMKAMNRGRLLKTLYVTSKSASSGVKLVLVEVASAMATSSSVYAHLTVMRHGGEFFDVVDHVSGYGYHLESTATGGAIAKAGIKLSTPIYGMGDVAIEKALEAIAKAANPRVANWKVVEA